MDDMVKLMEQIKSISSLLDNNSDVNAQNFDLTKMLDLISLLGGAFSNKGTKEIDKIEETPRVRTPSPNPHDNTAIGSIKRAIPHLEPRYQRGLSLILLTIELHMVLNSRNHMQALHVLKPYIASEHQRKFDILASFAKLQQTRSPL